MKGRQAGAAAMQIFKNTANRGSYKNSPKIQPRGGTSFK